MPTRPEVRDTQRTLAALDAAHAKAAAALEQAVERRKAAVAAHDRRVAAAHAGVDQAVAIMAEQVSVELTAQLLGMDVATVRRCTKAHAQPAAGPVRSGK
jgi:hypothetical protein